MSNFIHWIIFVQIISESWPISSSSHVRIVFMLAPLLFGAQALEQSVPNFLDHLLHGPMVLIVLIFFRHAWVHWVRRVVRIARAYVCGARVRESERAFVRVLARLVSFLFCSSVITGIFFGLFKILLKNNALLAHDATMLVGLCVTAGVLFLLRSLRDTTLRVVPQGERDERESSESAETFHLPLRPSTGSGWAGQNTDPANIQEESKNTVLENAGRRDILLKYGCPKIPYVLSPELVEGSKDKGSQKTVSWSTYAILGLVQGLALLPGISRFASTYAAARWLGFTQRRAFQVCFLLELPVVIAAFVVFGIGGACMQNGWSLILQPTTMLVVAGATVVGYGALWCAWWLAERRLLWLFSGYLLLPILIVLYSISQ
ncbi:hypothetical protein K2W90_03610 [Candidatus Babeliales bacterium]|nr:hypothetical protein [Candidatus Babeliales bacterium]